MSEGDQMAQAERVIVTSGFRFSRRAADRLINAHVDEYLRYLKDVDDVERAKQNERQKERYRRLGRPDRRRAGHSRD